jgi:hypothetical protein
MGSSRKAKSVRATSARPGEQPSATEIVRKASNPAPEEVPEIPAGVLIEIEHQRGVLVTVITLLHCLHVVLQHREDSVGNGLNPRIEAAARWASLPEMTAILLERTHAVLSGLDSMNLTRASKAFES